jgi:hypothetical protein
MPSSSLIFAALLVVPVSSAMAQGSMRQITGAVTDQHHEPLRGAVVQIENESTNSVSSYVTGADGHYSFKRLDGDTDYKVWTTYRGKPSKTRFISKFKSKSALAINLTVQYP